FGFQSLELYQEWFDQRAVRDLFNKHHFFLTVYDVLFCDVRSGTRQVVFKRNHAAVREFRDCHGELVMNAANGHMWPAMERLLRNRGLAVAAVP
ncbi:MAG: hypothetical protein KJ667_03060, partial [Alphaproteobacteria bacterium]|nr:hypothetical protein [Alphaproteobacteria bacterium]